MRESHEKRDLVRVQDAGPCDTALATSARESVALGDTVLLAEAKEVPFATPNVVPRYTLEVDGSVKCCHFFQVRPSA